MDLFRLSCDENYDKICAQILLTTKGRLAYYCVLCGKYRDHDSFVAHLLEDCSESIDDDIKLCMSRLSDKSVTTSVKTVQQHLENNRHSIEEATSQPNKVQLNKLKSPIKREDSSPLQQENDSNLKEIEQSEHSITMPVDSESIQEEYCETIVEYIDAECLEDEEFDGEDQITYQIEQMDNEISLSYELQNEEIQIEEEVTQDIYQLDENYIDEPIEIMDEVEEITTHIIDSSKVLNTNVNENLVDFKKSNNTKDVGVIVRNVQPRNMYLRSSHIAPEERKYKCPVCGLAFKDNHNMNHHLRRHTNKKSFSCPDCPKMFYTSTEVRIHSKVHRRPPKEFLCTECGLTFESNYILVSHQKRHRGQRDYICQLCKRAFFSSRDLKRHLSSHSSERPFTCEICEASFKLKNTLNSHMKQHENKREHKCKFCDAAFNIHAGLHNHMKSKHGKSKSVEI